MAAPPLLAGTAQLSITWRLPAAAAMLLGADGVTLVVEGRAPTFAVAAPVPALFMALTLNVYSVPLVNSSNV